MKTPKSPPSSDCLLLTVEQCAAALQISRSALYPMLGKDIPVCRLGRSVRIPRLWVEEFIGKQVRNWEQGRAEGERQA